MRLLIFLFLLPIIFSQNIWNPEGTIIEFLNSDINPYYSQTAQVSLGNSVCSITMDSCGKITNQYCSGSIHNCNNYCSNCLNSCTDYTDSNSNCNNNEGPNQRTCSLTATIIPYSCSCNVCGCQPSNPLLDSKTIIADFSRLNDSISFNLEISGSYYQEQHPEDFDISNDLNIRWYRDPYIVLTVVDSNNDLDSITSFCNYAQINNNQLTINYSNIETESIEECNFQLRDNDICMEISNFKLELFIDNKGPNLFGFSNNLFGHTQNITFVDSISSPFLDFQTYDFLQNYGDNIIIIKKLSYCKFSNNCFNLYIGDFGSGLSSISLNDNNYNYNYQDQLINISDIITRHVKIANISLNFENQNKILQINAKDHLNNQRVYNLFLPFKPPQSFCQISYSKNGYTKLNYINCSLNYYIGNNNIKKGILLYYVANQNLNDIKLKYNKGLDNFEILDSNDNVINFLQININNYVLLGSLSEFDTGNYKLYYLSKDFFDNYEGVSDIIENNDNYMLFNLTLHELNLNLDYNPPNANVTFYGAVGENGEEINNIDLSNIGIVNVTFTPFDLNISCYDQETNDCIISVILDNGSQFIQDDYINISIDYQPSWIKIKVKDYLNNSKEKIIHFNVNNNKPDISYNFSVDPVDYYYTFTQNVTLIANASFEGDPNKIKNISIFNNNELLITNNSNIVSYNFTCEFGNICEYHVKIKAISILNTVKEETLNIKINKNSFIVSISPILSESNKYYLKDGIYYYKSNNNVPFLFLCYYDPTMSGVSIEKAYILDNENVKLIYTSDNMNNNIWLKNFFVNLDHVDLGHLTVKCQFNTSEGKINRSSSLNYSIDDIPPQIHVKIYDNGWQNLNSNYNYHGNLLTLNITINDSLSGIQYSKIKIDQQNYNFLDNFYYSEELEEGAHQIEVKTCDNLNNCQVKTYNIFIDNSPPIISKILNAKNSSEETYTFYCSDLTNCVITNITCNGNIDNYNQNIVQKTCTFNNQGYIIWKVCSKDYFNQSSCVEFSDYNIYSGFEIKQIPNLDSLICIKNSIIPIIFYLKNKNSMNNHIKVDITEGFPISYPKEINLKPYAHYNALFIFLCYGNNIKIKFSSGNIQYTRTINLQPVFFNLFD